MKKTPYRIEITDITECITPCPLYLHTKIGSCACRECDFFIEDVYHPEEGGGYVLCAAFREE